MLHIIAYCCLGILGARSSYWRPIILLGISPMGPMGAMAPMGPMGGIPSRMIGPQQDDRAPSRMIILILLGLLYACLHVHKRQAELVQKYSWTELLIHPGNARTAPQKRRTLLYRTFGVREE